MDIEKKLTQIFASRTSGPFLFVGSGLSMRYLGLDNWKALLSRFCVTGKPFEYYLAEANGDLPTVAQLLAEDFNRHWWEAAEYQGNVKHYKSKITDNTSALRIEICSYFSEFDHATAQSSMYAPEVELLSGLNVDGIITTNWDTFLEQMFPDYKVYIGQKELLFSNPQKIGEIYKIHGCSTAPHTLVLTNKDYKEFNERNAYLAAKLITIFVEHPIVFIGYSITDENIGGLLRAIAMCIGPENIEQLRRNLIFIEPVPDAEGEGVSETYIGIDRVQIPIVLIRTNDFCPIYRALEATKRRIPARVLRYCKEQLYELVKSSEPEKKLCVLDIDEIDKKEDVEFLVGVGVASREQNHIGEVGYGVIDSHDLIHDLLYEDRGYDAVQIVDNVLKRAGRNTQNIPVFKYLAEIGIVNHDAYKSTGLELNKWVCRDIENFRVQAYAKGFNKNRGLSMGEFIESFTPENVAAYIPFLSKEEIDLPLLKDFLIVNKDKMESKNSCYASNFRKLAALYDKLKWGW